MEEGFDINAFTAEVEGNATVIYDWLVFNEDYAIEIGVYDDYIDYIHRSLQRGGIAGISRYSGLVRKIKSAVENKPFYRTRLQDIKNKLSRPTNTDADFYQEIEDLEWDATKLLFTAELKSRLCSLIKPISGEVCDIAKAITAAIIPLQMAGQLNIRLEPVFFAMIAVVLTKIGIENYCRLTMLR